MCQGMGGVLMFVGLLSIWAELAISKHCKAPSFVPPDFISTSFIPKIYEDNDHYEDDDTVEDGALLSPCCCSGDY